VHKFKRLKKRYGTPDDVRRYQASRPMTLLHGDMHPANALIIGRSSDNSSSIEEGGEAAAAAGGSGGGIGGQVAIFDWAEINVSNGPEEIAHFLLRSRFHEDVSSTPDGQLNR
jgi:hypothetical protein